MNIELTDTQRLILIHAIEHTNGRVDWFPENIKGGARQKVHDGLTSRDLIRCADDGWRVTAAGYAALNRVAPESAPPQADPALEADVAAAEAQWAPDPAPEPPEAELAADAATTALTEVQSEPTPAEPVVARTPRTRANSKQAQVVELLKRPEGATIQQVCELTHWQAHTVRGTFAGAFKKRLGLNVVSRKSDGAERVYRIE